MTTPSQSDPLHDELWELVYGLLDERRAAELIEQIRSDPVLARRYAEVRLEADLLRDAARLDLPPVSLMPPAEQADAETCASPVGRPSAFRRRSSWLPPAGWLSVAALLVLGLGMWKVPPAPPRAACTALVLFGPPRLWAGQPARFRLQAMDVQQTAWDEQDVRPSGRDVTVTLELVDQPTGRMVHRTTGHVQAGATADLDLPAEAIRPGVQLRVTLADALSRGAAGAFRGIEWRLPDGSLQYDLSVEYPQWTYELAADPPLAPQRSGPRQVWQVDLFRRQLIRIEPGEPSQRTVAASLPEPAGLGGLAASAATLPEAETQAAASPPRLASAGPLALGEKTQQAESSSGLRLALHGLKEHYQPGEEVRLVIQATDVQGRPVQAKLAARVWNERWIGPGPAPLLAALLPALASRPQGDQAASSALALRAGAQEAAAGRPDTNSPNLVLVASSEELVRSALGEAVQTARRQVQMARWRRGLFLVALAGALASALLVWTAIFTSKTRPTRPSWARLAPGLSLVAASLLLVLWGWQQRPADKDASPALAMAPSSPPAGALTQADGLIAPRSETKAENLLLSENRGSDPLASAAQERAPAAVRRAAPEPGSTDAAGTPAQPPAAALAATADRALTPRSGPPAPEPADGSPASRQLLLRKETPSAAPSEEAHGPATLYFNAGLRTNDAGQVEISFSLPTAAGRYRLLLDAIGNGEVASAEHAIVCQP
jgi:hypothetical protein